MVHKLNNKKKKKRSFMSSFSICFLVVILAAILSWLIPAGNYDTLVYDEGSDEFIIYSADYDEEPKQIFLSSARTKTNWGWTHLKNCVEQHYKSHSSHYGFFLVDIFTSVLTGILTKKQYLLPKGDPYDNRFPLASSC